MLFGAAVAELSPFDFISMTNSDTWYLALGTLVLLCCFGVYVLYWAISGMRRGVFYCRHGWFYRGHDGWMFWAVTVTVAVGGTGIIVGTIWLGTKALR